MSPDGNPELRSAGPPPCAQGVLTDMSALVSDRLDAHFPRYEAHDPAVPVWDLTAGERGCLHRFFDTWPISPSGRYAAVFRTPFEDRLPSAGDMGHVLVIDLEEGGRRVVAETRGWEPQMGCNLNWGADDHTLIFNDLDVETWTPQIVRLNWSSGARATVPGGVYHVSPDGRYAAAASMDRMCRTQRGYGVVVPEDRIGRNIGAPEDDGLFITDLETMDRRLVFSLRDAAAAIPELRDAPLEPWEIYGFHVKWSPDGQRLIFTIRRFPVDQPERFDLNSKRGLLRFDVLTLRPDGTDVHDAVPAPRWEHGGHHINWYPDSRQLSMNLGGFGQGLRFVRVDYDGTDLRPIFDDVMGSGHPSIHPDGRHLISDTYAHEETSYGDGSIPLRWIDLQTGAEQAIVRMHSKVEPQNHGALRVDPHPIVDRSGHWVAFNGVADNTRHVFLADLRPLLDERATQ